jgi:hypothetical protein
LSDDLFQPFSSLRLAREGIEFHKIGKYKVVGSLPPTLIDYILNKRVDYILVFCR